jgi:DMSO/TMAO reductase YedYZ heme-binding membrane subunit
MPRRWAIVGWSVLGVAAMCAVLFAVAGTGEEGIRLVIRATARTSVVLFVMAFTASALRRAWPSPASAWLLANRRHVGVSFAVSHLAHFLAILALAGWSIHRFFADAGPVAGAFGGFGFVVIAALAATSFDRSAAWLGPRRWRRLHVFGVWYLWGIFFVSFAPRAAEAPLRYGPVALLLLAALALRLGTRRVGTARPAAEFR